MRKAHKTGPFRQVESRPTSGSRLSQKADNEARYVVHKPCRFFVVEDLRAAHDGRVGERLHGRHADECGDIRIGDIELIAMSFEIIPDERVSFALDEYRIVSDRLILSMTKANGATRIKSMTLVFIVGCLGLAAVVFGIGYGLSRVAGVPAHFASHQLCSAVFIGGLEPAE